MKKGEWLNWLLCLLTGHQDAMATTPDLKFRKEDSLIRLLKAKDGSTPKDVTNAASSHHLLTRMLYQTHMNEWHLWEHKRWSFQTAKRKQKCLQLYKYLVYYLLKPEALELDIIQFVAVSNKIAHNQDLLWATAIKLYSCTEDLNDLFMNQTHLTHKVNSQSSGACLQALWTFL